MDLLGISGVTAILLIGAVTGFVELVKALFDKNWRTAVIIFGAGLVGGLVTLFPEINITMLTGIVGGLAASGAITISQNLGKSV